MFYIYGYNRESKSQRKDLYEKGDTYSIQLKGSYTFSSKNTKKITVSKKGEISAKKVGTGIVTARKGKKKYPIRVKAVPTD